MSREEAHKYADLICRARKKKAHPRIIERLEGLLRDAIKRAWNGEPERVFQVIKDLENDPFKK